MRNHQQATTPPVPDPDSPATARRHLIDAAAIRNGHALWWEPFIDTYQVGWAGQCQQCHRPVYALATTFDGDHRPDRPLPRAMTRPCAGR
jgi:hypothetical protein